MRHIRSTIFILTCLIGASILTPYRTSPVQAQAQTSVPATLGDYWNGKANWQLVTKWTLSNTSGWQHGFYAGSHIEIVNGKWYLFYRQEYPAGENCTFLGTEYGTWVRSSDNQGQSWNNDAIPLMEPTDDLPWECAAIDGDTYFDAAANKWRYLFQCIARNGIWNACYLERSGPNPMGPFTAPAGITNPVLSRPTSTSPGPLWNLICNSSSDHCVSIPNGQDKVFDEGTFDIIQQDGQGRFWVGFHGFDGVRGYRGLAKTTNFSNFSPTTWLAGGAGGTPTDAILDRNDGVGWRDAWLPSGNVGAGAASILYDHPYYYQISEFMDTNLLCTPGQNWHYGIFRSSSLTNLTWQQYPLGNPIFYSSKAIEMLWPPPPQPGQWTTTWCNLTYGRLFRDPATNTIYLKLSHLSYLPTGYPLQPDQAYEGIYLYKLVPSNNLLRNGDLWMEHRTPATIPYFWSKYPIGPTNLLAYPLPNKSSDGNQYMEFNCGTNPNPCQAGQSVYQDIDVSAYRGAQFTAGGKFASGGGTGALTLSIFQLDANGVPIAGQSQSVAVNVSPSYVSTTPLTGVIQPTTKYIRYQLYPGSASINYRADEMFVSIPATPNNQEMAQGKAVTTSGVWNNNPSFVAANALDGNELTRWASNASGASWIQVDLGNVYPINRVQINWETAGAYAIQASTNGTTFATVKSGSSPFGEISDDRFAVTEARYIRVSADSYRSIWSLRVFRPQDLAAGRPVTASGVWQNNPLFVAANAVDQNDATRWAANETGATWIQVDLGALQNINRVRLKWETAGTYSIQVSANGSTFTTIKSGTAATNGVTDDQVPTSSARYVRISAGSYRSIWTLQVFRS
jgi:hypothetical protein